MVAVTTKLVEVFHDRDHYIHTHAQAVQIYVTRQVFHTISDNLHYQVLIRWNAKVNGWLSKRKAEI